MSGKPAPSFSLSMPSSSSTGDALFETAFDADMSDNIYAGGSQSTGIIGPIVRELATGVIVALLARWAWSKIK